MHGSHQGRTQTAQREQAVVEVHLHDEQGGLQHSGLLGLLVGVQALVLGHGVGGVGLEGEVALVVLGVGQCLGQVGVHVIGPRAHVLDPAQRGSSRQPPSLAHLEAAAGDVGVSAHGQQEGLVSCVQFAPEQGRGSLP